MAVRVSDLDRIDCERKRTAVCRNLERRGDGKPRTVSSGVPCEPGARMPLSCTLLLVPVATQCDGTANRRPFPVAGGHTLQEPTALMQSACVVRGGR